MLWKSCVTGYGAARALLLLCFAAFFTGHLEAATPARQTEALQVGIAPQFAIADFDGDSKPDLATVQIGRSDAPGNHYRIRFQLSTGSSQNIDLITPADGLDISSRDVNGDDFLDVIVTTAGTNQPVAVLLNDGRGNFTASNPSVFPNAFRNFERSWSGSTDEMREASPALFPRLFSGDAERSCRTFSSPYETKLFSTPFGQFAALYPGVSFFGRAPPSLDLPL